MTADGVAPDRSDRVGIVRLIVGLLQGLALYLLFNSLLSTTWPATDGPLFAALGAVAIFAPLAVVASLSYLRTLQLVLWAIAVAIICAGLAWYDIVRDPQPLSLTPRNVPSPQVWIALGAGLFIAHCLLVAGAVDRRLIAPYATYFDVSWKYGVQIALALAFTGAFWALLALGSALFELIKISFLAKLLVKPWFAIPATTLAFTCAVHITDVRVGIVRGVRTLGCNLLSWLLPLMTLLAVAFLAALPFTGLEPLWNTHFATVILLAAAASLIFLVNAAYQDGPQADSSGARQLSPLLRIPMAVASATLVPISLLAAYGIALRIEQHGWTPDRIIVVACTVVALCYAVGYLTAAIRWKGVFAWLETTNVAVSLVVLAILVALFTPIADPARISVNDQVRRLQEGVISPDAFDYVFLRFNAGRYGTDALRALAEQKAIPLAAERSAAMLARNTRYEARQQSPPRTTLTADARAANLTVVSPKGRSLPRQFLDTNWHENRRSYLVPACLTSAVPCDAIVVDLDSDGVDEIILLRPGASHASVFRANAALAWDYFSDIPNIGCTGVRADLLAGNFSIQPPLLKEIEVAGRRLRMNWPADCSAPPSK